MSDWTDGVENGHHRYNRHGDDPDAAGFPQTSKLQFGLVPLSEGDAARLQQILTTQECLKWDIAFRQFWNNPSKPWRKALDPYNPKGFSGLKFGRKGRPMKDNYDEEDADYIDSLTRTIL